MDPETRRRLTGFFRVPPHPCDPLKGLLSASFVQPRIREWLVFLPPAGSFARTWRRTRSSMSRSAVFAGADSVPIRTRSRITGTASSARKRLPQLYASLMSG